jgi:hypothetical protein
LVTDNGKQQPRTDSTRVNINVIRVPPPTFVPNNEYRFTINENENIGFDVVTLNAIKDDLKVSLCLQYFVMQH